MKLQIITYILFIQGLTAYAQNYAGRLMNQADSTPLALAVIKLAETEAETITNEKGDFYFSIPANYSELHFEISYVGCHTAATASAITSKLNLLYVACSPNPLAEVQIKYMPAKEIVKKAVSMIPTNYFDSSYASPSFYREYRNVNNKFMNLVEAQGYVVFNLKVSNGQINSKEAIAVEQIKRSPCFKTESFDQDNFPDFMQQNPVYHLTKNLLNPMALELYTFKIDTVTPDIYIISYSCPNFTNENHGIDNYDEAGLSHEGKETGTLTIDRSSYAFIKIERTSLRNDEYRYPKNNNFVLPDRKYTQEFVEASFVAEYQPVNGKWYLKTLLHSYTNNFFRTGTYEKAYRITDSFEWFADTATRNINKDLLNKFYFNPNLVFGDYKSEEISRSAPTPEFYFFKKESVLKGLKKK